MPSTTPMWTSRGAWLAEVTAWATAEAVRGICAQLGCSQAPAKLLAIAAAWAEFADHATGRNAAVSRGTLAQRVGCTPRTVTTAWQILQAAGWATEAARGHGGAHALGRRTSVWHLTPNAAAIRNFHLPPSGGDLLSSPVPNNSPSAPSAPKTRSTRPNTPTAPRQRRRRRSAPRPLPLQRLAAQLAPLCLGVDRGHIGRICDALSAAGIDPAQWTGRRIADALNADMKASGWTWPDRIERPTGFLVSRLRRLTSGGAAAGPEHGRTPAVSATPASPAAPPPAPLPAAAAPQPAVTPRPHQQHTHRASNARAICMQLAARPRSSSTAAAAAPQRKPFTHPAASSDCSHCGSAGAPRRRHLPAARAHICDPCWDAEPPTDTSSAVAQPEGTRA